GSSETNPNNNDNPIRTSSTSISTASQFPSACDKCAKNVAHYDDTAAAAAISSEDVPRGEVMMERWKGEESLNDSESPPNRPVNTPLVFAERTSSDWGKNSSLEAFSDSCRTVTSSEQRPKIELALKVEIGTNASVQEILEEACPLPRSYGLESDPKKEGMGPELIQEENSVPMPQVVMMTHKHTEKIRVQAGIGAPRPVGTGGDTIQDPRLQVHTIASAITSFSSTVEAGDEMPEVVEGGHVRGGLDVLNDSVRLVEGRTNLSTIQEESDHLEEDSTVTQGQRTDHYTIFIGTENQTHFQVDYSLNGITEAYLVEDEVFIALLTKPWWKQRRTRFFSFAAIVILSTSLGIALSRESRVIATQSILMVSTPSPSISSAPSSSLSPSFSPSSCAFTISSNAQKLDLLHPEASDPVIAMDGRNLIVASRVVPAKFYGSLLIEFYSLSDESKWERVGDFVEGGFDWAARESELFQNQIYSSGVYVSLSGGTAMVGTPCDIGNCPPIQSVTAYKQNSYGRWERVSDGSPHSSTSLCGFGMSTTVDDTLMVTLDFNYCGDMMTHNSAYLSGLFRDKWIEVGDLSNQTIVNFPGTVRDASISGNTVVVKRDDDSFYGDSPCSVDIYLYDPIAESVTRLEESLENILCSGAMSLSGDHFVLANHSGVSVLKRNDPSATFRSLQFIDSLDYGEGFGRSLSIDEGILVVGSNNYTHVFSVQDHGRWEEMLVLDQSFDHYQISGRALVAANRTEAVAMTIDNCMLPVPTLMPSVSSAPFTCYKVEFNFSNFIKQWYPEYGLEAMIRRIDGNSIVIETFPLDEGDWDKIEEIDLNDESLPNVFDQLTALSYSKSMCLPDGSYEFILNLQDYYMTVDHYYTVKSYEQLITQGAVNPFTWGNVNTETVGFNLPFDGKTTHIRPTISPTLPSMPYQTWFPTLNENKLTPSLVPESLYVSSVTPTLSKLVMGTPHKTSVLPTVHFKTWSPTQSPITSVSELTSSPMSPPTMLM
ncbi:hypothetical protein ACHAWX_003982, partial [Stephanocyclus meneghinianus]